MSGADARSSSGVSGSCGTRAAPSLCELPHNGRCYAHLFVSWCGNARSTLNVLTVSSRTKARTVRITVPTNSRTRKNAVINSARIFIMISVSRFLFHLDRTSSPYGGVRVAGRVKRPWIEGSEVPRSLSSVLTGAHRLVRATADTG